MTTTKNTTQEIIETYHSALIRTLNTNETFTGHACYEPVRNLRIDEDTDETQFECCDPEDAEAWGVYVQLTGLNRDGTRYYEYQWIEDMLTEEDAQEFVNELGVYIQRVFLDRRQ